jgi:hypothetical protein
MLLDGRLETSLVRCALNIELLARRLAEGDGPS